MHEIFQIIYLIVKKSSAALIGFVAKFAFDPTVEQFLPRLKMQRYA
jgi:hypothetical protein